MTETLNDRITFSRDNYIILNGKRTSTYVRQGSYIGTTDDRLGRWYAGEDGYGFRPWGAGFSSRREAAEAVVSEDWRRQYGRL